jgi:hypothetical protein
MKRDVELLFAAICWLAITCVGFSQSQVMVYTNDFEVSAGEQWSRTNLSVTPKGNRKFLGEFGAGSTLVLNDLPAHNVLLAKFDLYIINSWDGNAPCCGDGPDIFSVVESKTNVLLRTTFSTHELRDRPATERSQAYPAAYPGAFLPWSTGCSEANTLGYDRWWLGWSDLSGRYNSDCVYHIAKAISHSSKHLELSFSKGWDTINVQEESWGLDNLSIAALTLSDEEAPTIVAEPEDIRLAQNGDGTAFTVTAASLAPMTFQWYHRDFPIPEATNSFCMITNLNPDALGDYRVVVVNLNGTATSRTAFLSVEPPLIRDPPANRTRRVGDTNAVAFSVTTIGAGNLKHQWFHNGIAITNGGKFRGADTSWFRLVGETEKEDEGEYRVLITNFAGMTNSASATLRVLPALPSLSLGKAVKPCFTGVQTGRNYQLQVSSDMVIWTNWGSPLVATNTTILYPQYWDVPNWDDLRFRLQVVP